MKVFVPVTAKFPSSEMCERCSKLRSGCSSKPLPQRRDLFIFRVGLGAIYEKKQAPGDKGLLDLKFNRT